MLTVKCNHCDNQFRCPPEMAGEQVECPHCEAHVRVPFDAPNLDAIKKRAESKTRPTPEAEPPADDDVVAQEQLPQKDVVQASVHDLYLQQRDQHSALTENIDALDRDLRSLSHRLHSISFQLFIMMLLLGATCLSVVILTIAVLIRL